MRLPSHAAPFKTVALPLIAMTFIAIQVSAQAQSSTTTVVAKPVSEMATATSLARVRSVESPGVIEGETDTASGFIGGNTDEDISLKANQNLDLVGLKTSFPSTPALPDSGSPLGKAEMTLPSALGGVPDDSLSTPQGEGGEFDGNTEGPKPRPKPPSTGRS